jgi:deazaflavin-dependent oxidoreductase (nitroreductase family)
MSDPAPPHARPITPVGPSLMVRLVMGPMSRMLNPLVATLAGRRYFAMAAQIHHVGRRSGKPYVTSVGARVHEGIVLIPLTFGNRSDWARNVRAAGDCTVRINGVNYHAAAPQFLTKGQAAPGLRPMFRPIERLVFNMLGIQQFMRLQIAAR